MDTYMDVGRVYLSVALTCDNFMYFLMSDIDSSKVVMMSDNNGSSTATSTTIPMADYYNIYIIIVYSWKSNKFHRLKCLDAL